MSSQPHIVLPWVVRRTRLPLLSLRCVGCRSESATTGEGRFRVNANGKLLDVWLLVRCVSCDRTSKLTVYERAPVRSFDPAELDGTIVAAGHPGLVDTVLVAGRVVKRDGMLVDVDLAALRTRLFESRNRIAAAAGIPLDGTWRPRPES
jgi:hypothetical protein